MSWAEGGGAEHGPRRPLLPSADKRALFIICTSELGPQIYELVASTSLEKNT